jgi:hypothetical protein
VAQRSREAAMAGVGHGAGAARPSASRHGGEKRNREKGIRSDGWGPLVSETRWEMKGRRAGWAVLGRRG